MCQAGDLILKEDELKLTPSGPVQFCGAPHLISMPLRPRGRGAVTAEPSAQ